MKNHDEHYLKESQKLIEMMSYPRPSRNMQHSLYKEFLAKFITPAMGEPDKHGNYIHIINDESSRPTPIQGFPEEYDVTEQFPTVCYMAHHDTVHNASTLDHGPYGDRIKYLPTKSVDDIITEKRTKFAGKPENFKPYLSDAEKQQALNVFVEQPEMIDVIKIERTYSVNDDGTMGEQIEDSEKVIKTKVKDPAQHNINCLGADCTVGVWLILEMIAAKVPGVYVIHADEEVGRVGAEAITTEHAKHMRDGSLSPYYWIDLVDVAISFDRKGTNEIITHQSGRTRCASDAFADSLSAVLSPDLVANGYSELVKSDKGSFTDSYSYRGLVNECINLCVGYTAQHTSSEKQDIKFAVIMRNALIEHGAKINSEQHIVVDRNCEEPTPIRPNSGNPMYPSGFAAYWDDHDRFTGVGGSTTVMGPRPTGNQVARKPQEPMSVDQMFEGYDLDDNFASAGDAMQVATNVIASKEKITSEDNKIILAMLCEEYADEVADFLDACGTKVSELVDYIQGVKV